MTEGDLRTFVNPYYTFDQRWQELKLCLELDGYRIAYEKFLEIEPSLPEKIILEDDLTRVIESSDLKRREELNHRIEESTNDYLKQPPDYNGCLINGRIALETLAKDISGAKSWGNALKYLRVKVIISEKQERGLAGVYTFISDGAHNSVGIDNREIARLGRSLALNMCYFLVKVKR